MVGIKMKKDQHDEEFSKVDLDYLLQTSIDNANANEDEVNDEVKIFQNALEFSDTKHGNQCRTLRLPATGTETEIH